MFNANTKQVGGDHYRSKYQVWDWITDMLMPFLPASIIKYVYRWRGKNGLEDIQKAHHYLQKYIEVEVARHTKLSKLTEKFLDSNDVPAKEQFIIGMLVEYQLGNMLLLDRALEELDALGKHAASVDKLPI